MKKLLKLAVTFVTMLTLCMLFAVISSAATYTVKYCDLGGGSKATAKTDENGVITLRDTAVTSNANKEFYGWFAEDGTFYKSGAEVTFTKDTNLREAYAYVVTTEADLKARLVPESYQGSLVRLGADITIEADSFNAPGYTGWNGLIWMNIDLNGYTLTVNSTKELFTGSRTSLRIFNSNFSENGKGQIIANKLLETSAVMQYNRYGEGFDRNCGFFVGKNVYIETTGSLFKVNYSHSSYPAGYSGPTINVYGTVVAKSIVNANNKTTLLSDINIHEGASFTITGTTWWENFKIFDYNKPFADLTIEDGATIITQNSDFSWIPSAEYITHVKYSITGGTFNASLPREVLKNGYHDMYNEETGYYDVEFVGCTLEGSNGEHNFVAKESYEGLVSTCEGTGVYYYRCECGDYYIDAADAVGHSYDVLTGETLATCTAKATKTYKCVRCDATQTTEYGEPLGHDFSVVTIVTPATSTQAGTKKYSCARCNDDTVSYTLDYTVDASQSLVSVTVKTADGTKTIMVPFTALFTITTNDDGTVTLNSISDTIIISEEESYTKADIVILNIPNGITNVATGAIKDMTALEIINVIDGAKVTFETASIDTCENLQKLVLLDNSTVTFNQFAVNSSAISTNESDNTTKVTTPTCPNLAIIDAREGNLVFAPYAFRFNGAIKQILMSSGHTYTFGRYSFQRSGLTEVVIPDNAPTSADKKCFAEALSLTYIYVGSNAITNKINTTINSVKADYVALPDESSIFDGLSNLEKAVFMDIAYFGKWTLSGKDPGKEYGPLNNPEIYIHSPQVKFHNESCNGRKNNYKIYIYCADSAPEGVPGTSNYVIFAGIPHKYLAEESLPTCTTPGSTGYSTDCPCGVIPAVGDEPLTYSVITNTTYEGEDKDGGSISIESTTPANGHSFTVLVSQTEAKCGAKAVATYKCANCDETQKQEVGEIKEHTEGETVTVKPSCTVDGYTQTYCSDCKQVISSSVVKATGHDTENVEWTDGVAPTCILTGTQVKICSACGVIAETKIVDATGHTEGEWQVASTPDCDDSGINEKYCTTCNVLIATEIVAPTGHEFDSAKGAIVLSYTYPNGYTNEGVIKIQCKGCSLTDDTTAEAIFEALGYSIKTDGTGLTGDFKINSEALAVYNQYLVNNGKQAIKFGIVMSNGSIEGGLVFDSEYKLTSIFGIQLEATTKDFSKLSYTITDFDPTSASLANLDLVISVYVIDENGISFIQRETELDGSSTATVNGGAPIALKSINLGKIAELLIPKVDADLDMPADTKQKFLEILNQIKNLKATV